MRRVLIVIITLLLVSTFSFAAGEQEGVKQVEGSVKEIVVIASGYDQASLDRCKELTGVNPHELFEKQTGIKVINEFYSFRDGFQVIEVQMNAKSDHADVISVDSPLTASYAVRGYTEPLPEDAVPNEENFFPSPLEISKWNGEYYARPFHDSSQLLYINVDLFEKAGIPVPPADVNNRLTWEQVVEYAQTIQSKLSTEENKIWGLTFQQISRPYQMLPLPQSLGAGSGVSPDGLHFDGYLNNEGWVKALQWYHDIHNTWNISPKGVTPDQTDGLFTGGKVAMHVGGTWLIPGCMDAKKNGILNFAMAPHPYFKEGEPVNVSTGWNYAINPYSRKKEAAKKFIKFWTGPEVSKMWHQTTNHMMANKGFVELIENDERYESFPYNIFKKVTLYELANISLPRPTTPVYLEWEDAVTKAFEDVRNGADPKATLDRTVQRVEKTAEKYR